MHTHRVYSRACTALLILFLSSFSYAQPEMPPSPVEVITLDAKLTQMSLDAVGALKASQGITVTAEVPGRIQAILFESGDSVKAGAPLIALNSSVLKAQLKSAQAKYTVSKADADRQASLLKTKAISQSAYEQAAATAQTDEAAVEEIKARIDQMNITAPFAGKLGLRKVSLGDYVQPGQPIVHLQSLDPILVVFSVPETYVGQATPGQTLSLVTATFPNETFKGRVTAVDSLLDPSTRSLRVEAKIPNADRKLLPGMFVDVSLALGAPTQKLHIPQAAVVYDPEGAYVYIMKDNKAVKQTVVLGARMQDSVIVNEGLNIGDVLITAGQQRLRDGAPVMVAPAAQQ